MKTIGFVISGKPNEKRRAILPENVKMVSNSNMILIERGYGKVLGIDDSQYSQLGACVVSTEDVYEADIICNPKTPTAEETSRFHQGQTLFGWIHAVQGRRIVDFLVEREMTAVAWEDMYYADSRHVFWRNNEIAGEAAVIHALPFLSVVPNELLVAVIGRGNTARGATRILDRLGAKVDVYDRKRAHSLRDKLHLYDLVVNAVMWDVFDDKRLIYRDDLAHMKRGSMIVDISCDEGLEIETSKPTTIDNPVYEVDGILHYAVDHTPTIFHESATKSIAAALTPFLDDLICERENRILQTATAILGGKIVDERILRYQSRCSVG